MPKFHGRITGRPIRLVFSILIYTAVVFASGYALHASDFPVDKAARKIKGTIAVWPRKIQAIVTGTKIERLTIDIKFRHFSRLAEQRKLAMAKFHLEVGEDDYVPATLTNGQKTIRADVRLKGDWIDHLNTDKWSFRIKVKGDDTFFGMKRFSIQHPKTRNYIQEWIYQQVLRREDVLALRYDFIEVTLNGKNLGIYAIEEHFEKRLVEHNRRPAGPIVRFDENLMYQIQLQHRPFREITQIGGFTQVRNTAASNIVDPFYAAPIDTFQTNQMLVDPIVFGQHLSAIELLEGFRRRELRTSQVFDVPTLARFFAISDLLGAHHSIGWRNLRFYYNPVTSLLEPIGFDADSGLPLRKLSFVINTEFEESAAVGERNRVFIDALFSDLVFFEEYIRVLERISVQAYLDELFEDLDKALQQKLYFLYSEFPYEFSKQVFYRNQQYLRTALDPVEGLRGHYREFSGGRLQLDLGNIQTLPLEVLALSYDGKIISELSSKIVLHSAAVFPPRPIEYHRIIFQTPENFVWSENMLGRLKVVYRILGINRTRESDVIVWPYFSTHFVDKNFPRSNENFREFDFLDIDEPSKQVFVKRGRWVVDRDLIIPPGYKVISGADTQLNLTNSASIVSFSPIYFSGTEELPIVVESKDGSGQGLVIMNAGTTSILEHVIFRNLSNPRRDSWQLTGAVTMYESPVQISNAKFTAMQAEDALHIVRSRFDIEDSLFGATSSDALDVDFCEGSITNSRFVDMGNDAIDVSGSVITIHEVIINGSGDKALSAGERSQVTASVMNIEKSNIAVASKDSSTVSISDIQIINGNIGLAAFQKKTEFGPAYLEVIGLEIGNVETPYLAERGSTMKIDGKVIEAAGTNLRSVLYDD